MTRFAPLAFLLAAATVSIGCSSSDDAAPTSTDTTDAGDAAASTEGDAATTETDSSVTPDSGVFVSGEALTVANKETWTWVDFPESKCANGQPTGIGVNLSDKSKRALVFLEGGGACWEETTCFVLKTASYVSTGYNTTQFDQESSTILKTGLFDRTDTTNPYRDYNFIYIPYCTGDVHSGDSSGVYGSNPTVEHHGLKNVQAYLKRIVPTFPDADRIVLAGQSAGGFGAMFHWWRVQSAFGSIRVDLVDDSGTMLTDPYLPAAREASWRKAWNLDAGLPSDCTTCGALSGMFDYYATKFPDHKMALLSYQRDTTLSQFFGPISLDKFQEGLVSLIATKLQHPNMRYYVAAGDGHVLTGTNAISTKGVPLYSWLNKMATDDNAGWVNLSP